MTAANVKKVGVNCVIGHDEQYDEQHQMIGKQSPDDELLSTPKLAECSCCNMEGYRLSDLNLNDMSSS